MLLRKENNDQNQKRLQMATPLLLDWYRQNARVLPWRQEPTPYRVWISEIMLQQTRVEAVKGYFHRFLEKLPNLRALAEVPEDELMKLWEGLGYYSRARNLQKTAKIVMKQYDGELPADERKLRKLPGIGPYTAGAVASIAFQMPVPAVDGNVLRVIMRLLANSSDIAKDETKRAVETLLTEIMPKDCPGDFNQALMELGAVVCLPNGIARCEHCPVAALCQAKQEDRIMELPVKTPKKPRRIENRTILLLRFEEKVALRKRPQKGLLARLWELPSLEGCLEEAQMLEWLHGAQMDVLQLRSLGKAKHIFTHIEWHMVGYEIELHSLPSADFLCQWIDAMEVGKNYALPSALRAYTKQIERHSDKIVVEER